MRNFIVIIAATVAFLLAAPAAQAGWEAYTTADVNMREGPGSRYAVITVIPAGELVYVHECPSNWCDVAWNGYRGYVYSRYLSGSGEYLDGYVAPPPVIIERYPYRGRYHAPHRRKHFDRHKRYRKYKRHRSRKHIEKPSRPRKHYKRSKRRKTYQRSHKRKSYHRSGKRRSIQRSHRSRKHLKRHRGQGDAKRPYKRRKKRYRSQ